MVDFSLPDTTDGFRTELRGWLTANLTDDAVAAGRPGATDEGTSQLIGERSRCISDARWAAISWSDA